MVLFKFWLFGIILKESLLLSLRKYLSGHRGGRGCSSSQSVTLLRDRAFLKFFLEGGYAMVFRALESKFPPDSWRFHNLLMECLSLLFSFCDCKACLIPREFNFAACNLAF
ncbi:hypothetical protein TorRG33x02_074510 [Trema orientale]|uniref:RNase H type-1 domain-containing protein n=1 Tax=Trema orientale TaxID=63057 RepID=A0A2P5FG43_TREOI|nr:hypothetical protein TorRG33x02_074510 [Trema orientale]